MARCYSVLVPIRHPPPSASMPDIWLVSDPRIDESLARALARLPRGSGLIFRHYVLPARARCARFRVLAGIARRHGHRAVWSGTAREARRMGADGVYGDPRRLATGPRLLRLATAHSLREIGRANRHRADAVLLSPVFATRSHPGAKTLGAARFRLLAARSRPPVIALGGMNGARARRLGWTKWAAIQAFSD
ncbi:thiamine phosphate synthase [Novosphingobium sp. PC22D]|uniref:thiamine phosphate synthase n=1 Tax=Novosphingobium sp. PC22D TaxID=1962403 RepID=UPI000BF22058|nr:thiamine phosphate synthase [Novosphingobium sp. PC22D]PEQ14164.1 thiamine phosphate synthase [Novosphingobium sp. PC22D]